MKANTKSCLLLALCRLIWSPYTFEPEYLDILRQESRRVADNRGLVVPLVIRVDVEIAELEVRRRTVVQVEDDALSGVRAVDVVPARVGDTSSIGRVGTEGAGEVDPLEVLDVRTGLISVDRSGTFVLVVVTTK